MVTGGQQPPAEVDILFLGGGTTACVASSRVAKANPGEVIMLIESGKTSDQNPAVYKPGEKFNNMSKKTLELRGEPHDVVSEPMGQLQGRRVEYLWGNTVGGASCVNWMAYARSAASDYDNLKQPGWAHKDLLPLFKKFETYHVKAGDPLHGYDGPIHVSYGSYTCPLGQEFIDAAVKNGVPYVEDPNDFKTGLGVSRWAKYINPTNGYRRSDAASSYLYPLNPSVYPDNPNSTSNIHVVTRSKVVRVLFDDNNKAIGAEFETASGERKQVGLVKARKLVVLSAGSINNPCILERSGVGRKEVIEKAGGQCRIDLRGVGENMQDHPHIPSSFKSLTPSDDQFKWRREPAVWEKAEKDFAAGTGGYMGTNACDTCAKLRPTPEELASIKNDEFKKVYEREFNGPNCQDKPLVQMMLWNFMYIKAHYLPDPKAHGLWGDYISLLTFLNYPESRGSIHIKDLDPKTPGAYIAPFVTNEIDVPAFSWAYKKGRQIVRSMPSFGGEVDFAHPHFSPTSKARIIEDVTKLTPEERANLLNIEYTDEDEKAIDVFVRQFIATTWHALGTCSMKAKEQDGVLDARLNVHDTKNLKVMDLSILNNNIGSNTYHTALVIGEKGACLIAEDLGLKL
ncbi:GMC oxidoreductase [Atractiella rhizophila]|nr:GMC oxidoreductase [Atractiella rhizophila]